jgi:uncharacterized protein YeeX (DUF496 family)
MGQFVDRAIYDPGYATSSRAQRRAEALYDQAQDIIKANASWKKDVDTLVKELNKAMERAADDKALKNLGVAVERFERSLKAFKIGGPKAGLSGFVDGKALWSDITQVLLPRVLSVLKTIPMPRVEYTVRLFLFLIRCSAS